MNPFNWNGPEFLVFYLILSVALISAQLWLRRTRETEAYVPGNTPKLTDPYLVAYLAGGANALIRCVTVSLLERKVLTAVGGKSGEVVMDPAQAGLLQSPLEGVVARLFDKKRPAFDVFKALATSPPVIAVGQQYQTSLEGAGLLPNKEQRSTNLVQGLMIAGMLAAVAGVKLILALERGHRNVMFLIVLGAVACVASLVLSQRRLTQPGKDALADLKQLFGALKDKAKSAAHVSPAEVALVAAVFGMGALGGARQMYAKNLFPASSSSSGCGSSCGSSSSGGDSGGSSCGGGGGCGGCGGS